MPQIRAVRKDVTLNPGSSNQADQAAVSVSWRIKVGDDKPRASMSISTTWPHDPHLSIAEFESRAYEQGSEVLKILSDYLARTPD